MDGKHVVFGKVIAGFDDVFKTIENAPTGPQDRPKEDCVIANCGVYDDANPPALYAAVEDVSDKPSEDAEEA